jgi:hypothetical protein
MFTMVPTILNVAVPVLGPSSSLLHLDGANGSTSFPDFYPKTWTRNGTSSAISTAQSKFGGASLAVGTGGQTGGATNNGIKTVSTADIVFGTGDFTVDWQQYWRSFTDFQTVIDKGGTNVDGLLLQTGSGDGKIVVYVSGSALLAESTAPTLNTWNQYQLTRSGSTMTLKRNGTTTATATLSGNNLNSTANWCWGAYADGTYATDSYLDDCRITKGTALAYTNQTAAWPN